MQPFSTFRRDGKIVLEIDEAHVLQAAAQALEGRVHVSDRETFLRFFMDNFFTLTHDLDDGDRVTWWQRLTESLAKAAASTGHGIRRDPVVVPTCGCDPEEHDGG